MRKKDAEPKTKKVVSEKSKKHSLPRWKKILLILLLLILFAAIILVVMYPVQTYLWSNSLKDAIQTFEDVRVVEGEEEIIKDVGEEAYNELYRPYKELYQEMKRYNAKLYVYKQKDLVDAFSYAQESFSLKEYGLDSDVFGTVSIPKINVIMPLYLGCSKTNMAKGFAQLTETSMPIGGPNTNCVIAGHRGYRGNPYLRDVEEIEIGDMVYIENLWETLAYQVVEIKIVAPYDSESIKIQEGRDLVTLLTCHPYRVANKRYLVICERVEWDESEEQYISYTKKTEDEVTDTGITITSPKESQTERWKMFIDAWLPIICLLIVLVAFVIGVGVVMMRRRKQKKRKLKVVKEEDKPA